MISKLKKITFRYRYEDPDSNFTGIIYHKENDFLDYGNRQTLQKIIEAYMREKDLSMVLKSILDIESVGGDFFG